MRGPATLSAEVPSREWYEPPDEPEELEEDDEESGVVDPSDWAYENARDKRMEQ